MKEEKLYTPEELSEKLKLSKYTIYEMIKRGDIPAYRIGRSLRVSESQLKLYFIETKKVENVYNAEIITEDDSTYALTNGIKIRVSTELNGRVKISIPPEDILISIDTFTSSARNMFKGTVKSIDINENKVKLHLDIGIPILALITKQSMDEMNIKKGDELYAVFKTMSVRVINL
ncbi:helix-turn-helix domain-containing protein [Sporosalibacterium faouarense]|uniref:helix-turn-helix domain-containing protein n=1 Tax=Sporosalibacterium faouarense TaxID=516123 RepID=UPI00141C290E|nr:helix-turn-helix domain-containing protein [Sporosalibacterium faouarense]MTI46594.1 helix-turn-helix domain-containing protein [Bacillota bacterium]